jgi:4-diphosphocytidyl-2C-methyl-D-erythritol kinase
VLIRHTTTTCIYYREGLSTGLVFKTLDLGACSSVVPESLLDSFETQGALVAAEEGRLINDLEPPAFQCEPKLKALREEIERQMGATASGVMMSGSGTIHS